MTRQCVSVKDKQEDEMKKDKNQMGVWKEKNHEHLGGKKAERKRKQKGEAVKIKIAM